MNRLEPLGREALLLRRRLGLPRRALEQARIQAPHDSRQTCRVPPIPTLVEVFKAFGANPVPMIWGEVYLAVKQGTVDGLELPVTTAVSDKSTRSRSITRGRSTRTRPRCG